VSWWAPPLACPSWNSFHSPCTSYPRHWYLLQLWRKEESHLGVKVLLQRHRREPMALGRRMGSEVQHQPAMSVTALFPCTFGLSLEEEIQNERPGGAVGL
jgi:hypothetical protein